MTNTYLTGNPLGSTAVKDLYDNASNFDDAMNSASPSFTDRLGLRRETWAGMEKAFDDFLLASGYEFIGDYDVDGPLTIMQHNQIFSKDGEYWRASPTLVLPYTTVNNWVVDQSKFVSVGDAVLRSDLANGSAYLVDSEVVGFDDPLAPSEAKTASDMFGMQPVSVLRFIPVSLHAAITAGTSTTNVHTYINSALSLGLLLHFPQGQYYIGGTLTMVAGGGIIGEGEKTKFIRNFTGGQVLRHPGGNQLDSPIILRDFSVRKAAAITTVAGDTGIDIGYSTAWGGRGDISNILIFNQWDGFKWRGGSMNPIHNVQVHEGAGNGFLGIDARGELVSCLAQYNAGHGYSIFAQTQNETGIQLTSCGTFANQGWGYLFDAAVGVIGANIYLKGVSSSTDGMGGIGFVKEYRQIWMTQILSESAGDAYIPYPSFVVHNDAKGLYMVGGCKNVVGSDIYIQTCRSGGAYFDSVTGLSMSNLIVVDNGRGGLGGEHAVGVNFNSNNTNFVMSGVIANFGPTQTVDIASSSASNEVDLSGANFRTFAASAASVRFITPVRTTATSTVASAPTITLPAYLDYIDVSGTTTITGITASHHGRRVTLRFLDVLTVTDGGALQLAGNLVSTVGSTLTLICDGSNWSEVGRAVI